MVQPANKIVAGIHAGNLRAQDVPRVLGRGESPFVRALGRSRGRDMLRRSFMTLGAEFPRFWQATLCDVNAKSSR